METLKQLLTVFHSLAVECCLVRHWMLASAAVHQPLPTTHRIMGARVACMLMQQGPMQLKYGNSLCCKTWLSLVHTIRFRSRQDS